MISKAWMAVKAAKVKAESTTKKKGHRIQPQCTHERFTSRKRETTIIRLAAATEGSEVKSSKF
jgi:hypothetical protein